MAYIGTEPKDVRSFGRAKFDYTATQGQTAFTGADDDGKTLGFTDGQMEVFVNGILMDESDFSTSNGNTVTLASAANLNDIISIVAMQTDIPNSDYVPASGGTFSGNVTHSGTVTNSSTTTMAGDLTIDTNTFHVDVADNRVGIGTTTPTSALSIEGSGFTDSTIRLKRTAGGTNNDAGLQFTSAAGANSGYGMGGIWFKNSLDDNAYALIRARTDDSTGTSGRLDFITSDAAVSNSTASRLTIDSSGRVTMPSQIGFSYCGSKSYVIAATGTQVMTSSNVWSSNVNHGHNRGSHFDVSTGRFTCPIAGRYLFMFNCQMSDFGSGYLYSYMRLNQSVFSYTQKSQQNTWTAHVHTAIIELNANDYVDMAWTNNYVSGQIHYPEFTGQLIG